MEFLEVDGRHNAFRAELAGSSVRSAFIDVFGGRKRFGRSGSRRGKRYGLVQSVDPERQISWPFQDESVILRVDFEKHVAFFHPLIVLHIALRI